MVNDGPGDRDANLVLPHAARLFRPPCGRAARLRVVAPRRDLPGLPALVRRLERRRHRRPARHHRPARRTSPSLGVDAVWLSPFYTSPQADAGYDVADYCDVDPLFGTLADFDALLERAHGLGLRVIVDLVPNHSSDEHVWFQAALAAAPGSPERARYIFRDGRGENGELPPEQLGVRSSAARPGPASPSRRHARPVVPAPVRHHAARLRLGEPRGPRGVPVDPAVLARPRRRRLPRRRRARPDQGARPARLRRHGLDDRGADGATPRPLP